MYIKEDSKKEKLYKTAQVKVQRDNTKTFFNYDFVYNSGLVVTLKIPHSSYKIQNDKVVFLSEWENRIKKESIAMAKANALTS